MDTLLTCDPRLAKNLGPQAQALAISSPTQYWERMSVPKGTRPMQVPHYTNPLAACDWWHW